MLKRIEALQAFYLRKGEGQDEATLIGEEQEEFIKKTLERQAEQIQQYKQKAKSTVYHSQ